jgi:hypothetical protein
LTNLASLAGCADAAAMSATLQKNFGSIFPAPTTPSDAVAATILSTLKSEPKLACKNLG